MNKYIEEFHKLKIFHKKDIVALTADENSAKELLRKYKQQGLISQVRRDLYVATDLATKTSSASKYEIGCQINTSSYLSYHTALEYHGLAHQVFYEMQICSKERFNNFEYNGISYVYSESKPDAGVITPPADTLIRVTDLERTVLDCMNQIDRSGGLEETIVCFALITYVNEQKLLDYLTLFNKQALYQKTGFILSYFQKEMKLNDAFFELCKSKIGKSTRYLTDKQESKIYFKEWKLYAPKNILAFLEQGGNVNV
jgi:predicted transcriptional regulator of viral defense system